MTLVKDTQLGNYVETGSKKVDGRAIDRKQIKKQVNEHNSLYVLWLVAYKHKMGILLTGNVVLVLNFVFPMWFNVVRSVIETIVQ